MDETQKDKFAGQEVVFQCLGESLLDNAFMGYNACIFAYGQTGSGKSYTMMGSAEQPGLIPRLCSSLFSRTVQEAREGESFTVEVSYMEIYNEKVRDLLDPKGSRQALRVREHQVLGPYVDGLSRLAVANYKDIECLMSEGNKSRTVAATNMNEESSRSHGVFNITLTHTLMDLQSGTSGEKVSKLSLVDLAGSERAAKTGAAGERLKEGSNINKSLSTLGLVISALAEQSAGKTRGKFVPYRDSVLTWLLKDSLGGNSRTAMVATISPAADNYDETLSTLRYAHRAKSIVNHAVVNEDPNARIIRELREEVEKLREQLTEAESMKAPELKERLEESEKLIQEMTVTWEDKLRKTEAVAQERQKQLESLGISLQSSGIRVVHDKCFLVNLNADPALNELLVYYLKEHTRVGSATSQDIQLCGMAIQAQHCVLDITPNDGVVLTPHCNARTWVNGAVVSSPVRLHHGDRILWGNNHFFRINLPKHLVHTAGEEDEEEGGARMKSCLGPDQLEVDFDASSDVSSEAGFEFAQAEVMMKGMASNDPLQSVLQTLERQHEEEKRCALERQRLMYEQELQQLRQRLHPERSSHLLDLSGSPPNATAPSAGSNKRMRRWSEDREAMITRSLRRLKEQIVRANLLAQEACFITEELNKRTEYLVTLQIPAANLDANRKRDMVLSEPAIQVRRKGKGKQIWAMEKMENRLVDMRELYQEWKDFDEDSAVMRSYFKRADPFFDEQENHSLIGVANVFLACLFYDVKLQYAVPIINQKGEVAARLHVEVWRGTEGLEEQGPLQGIADGDLQERNFNCVVKILQATGLPRHLSNFVFCQFHFWGQQEPTFIAPELTPSLSPTASRDPQCTVVFDISKELSVPVSEDFLEHLSEGALAIEVYGHKQANHRRNLALWDLAVIQAKTRSLRERWSEVTRRLEVWVQVMELNDAGQFTAVEVLPAKDVRTGGIFQLRQGQSRRIQVQVCPVPDSGTMPLICSSILSVSIGDVKVQSTAKGRDSHSVQTEDMDSYQEVDVERMRRQWLATLTQRQEYLDQQLHKILSKADKSEDDLERESQLLECRLTLTEERNAVLVPSAGSGIPGAPVEGVPVPGMETHIPVLFLDLSADDLQSSLSVPLGGGLDAYLDEEFEDDFFDLHIVKHYDSVVKVEASWDSTVHECPQLSRVATGEQRVYLTIRVVLELSHPAHMQLVLRKRICVHVTGRQGFAQSLLKRMSQRSPIPGCGVTFEIVSNIPGDYHGPEDREMLARLAASADDEQSADSEAAIEKYLRSVLAVENILTLDRLRQEVAVREQLAGRGKTPRRCLSSPNVNRLSASTLDVFSSTCKLHDFQVWETDQDLSAPPKSRRTMSTSGSETTTFFGSAVSSLPPVKAVPTLQKSLLPGGKEDVREHQRNVPGIIVQSASVEEGMSTYLLAPYQDIVSTESPKALPLPSPTIPEIEDCSLNEASSRYTFTSTSNGMPTGTSTGTPASTPGSTSTGMSTGAPGSSSTGASGSTSTGTFIGTSGSTSTGTSGSTSTGTSGSTSTGTFIGTSGSTSTGTFIGTSGSTSTGTFIGTSGSTSTGTSGSTSTGTSGSTSTGTSGSTSTGTSGSTSTGTSGSTSTGTFGSTSTGTPTSTSTGTPGSTSSGTSGSTPARMSGSMSTGTSNSTFTGTSAGMPTGTSTGTPTSTSTGMSTGAPGSSSTGASGSTSTGTSIGTSGSTSTGTSGSTSTGTSGSTSTGTSGSTSTGTSGSTSTGTSGSTSTGTFGSTSTGTLTSTSTGTPGSTSSGASGSTPARMSGSMSTGTSNSTFTGTSAGMPTGTSTGTPTSMSTGTSTNSLSDIYTLSWDLPPLSGQGADEAGNKVPQQSNSNVGPHANHSEPAARSVLPQSKPKEPSNHPKTNPSPLVQGDELDPFVESKSPEQLEDDSVDSEQLASSLLALENKTKPEEPPQTDSKPKTCITESVQMDVKESTKPIQKESERKKKAKQSPASVLTQMSNELKSSDPLSSSQDQTSTKASGSKAPSFPASWSTEEVSLEAEPSVQTSKAANTFKIQKVQSSDLKSFQRILSEPENQPGQTEQVSASEKSELDLSEPLELVLDSEDGEATASLSIPDWLKVGAFVSVGTNKSGTVRYVGPTDFADGIWVGVELEVPAGRNDGSVSGKHYFHCNPGYGVLVRPDRLNPGGAKRRRQHHKRRSANLSGSASNLAALAKGESATTSTSTSTSTCNSGEEHKS
nr:kinesin-like protein KIF13B [Nerophis lumbriciformis]